MTTYLLKAFRLPQSPSVEGLVEVVLDQIHSSTLQISYHLPKNTFLNRSHRSVPAEEYRPQDKLYENECIELFLSDGTRTLEYNFHPGGFYYGFATKSYRSYVPVDVSKFKPIESHLSGNSPNIYSVSVDWKIASGPIWPDFKPSKVLTPVVLAPVPPWSERTFWSQNHASDKPDFHNIACYAELG